MIRNARPLTLGVLAWGLGNSANDYSVVLGDLSIDGEEGGGTHEVPCAGGFSWGTGTGGSSSQGCGGPMSGKDYFYSLISGGNSAPPIGQTAGDAPPGGRLIPGSEDWRRGGWRNFGNLDIHGSTKGRWVKERGGWSWYRDIELACAYSHWGASVCKYYTSEYESQYGHLYSVECCVDAMDMEICGKRAALVRDFSGACYAWCMYLDPAVRGVTGTTQNYALLVNCNCARDESRDDPLARCMCKMPRSDDPDRWEIEREAWGQGKLEECYMTMLRAAGETDLRYKRLVGEECIDVCYVTCISVSAFTDPTLCRQCCEAWCQGSSYYLPDVIIQGISCAMQKIYA